MFGVGLFLFVVSALAAELDPNSLPYLLSHPKDWPKQVTLKEAVECRLMIDGKPAGSMTLPASSRAIKENRLAEATALKETSHNLLQLAAAPSPRSERLQHEYDSQQTKLAEAKKAHPEQSVSTSTAAAQTTASNASDNNSQTTAASHDEANRKLDLAEDAFLHGNLTACYSLYNESRALWPDNPALESRLRFALILGGVSLILILLVLRYLWRSLLSAIGMG
jgi:hypothetical protein